MSEPASSTARKASRCAGLAVPRLRLTISIPWPRHHASACSRVSIVALSRRSKTFTAYRSASGAHWRIAPATAVPWPKRSTGSPSPANETPPASDSHVKVACADPAIHNRDLYTATVRQCVALAKRDGLVRDPRERRAMREAGSRCARSAPR